MKEFISRPSSIVTFVVVGIILIYPIVELMNNDEAPQQNSSFTSGENIDENSFSETEDTRNQDTEINSPEDESSPSVRGATTTIQNSNTVPSDSSQQSSQTNQPQAPSASTPPASSPVVATCDTALLAAWNNYRDSLYELYETLVLSENYRHEESIDDITADFNRRGLLYSGAYQAAIQAEKNLHSQKLSALTNQLNSELYNHQQDYPPNC